MIKIILFTAAVPFLSWSVGAVDAGWSRNDIIANAQESRVMEVKESPRCWRRRWIGTWHCKHRRNHTGRA